MDVLQQKALPTHSVGRANQRGTTFVYIGINNILHDSNASCPVTWAGRRNLCQLVYLIGFLGFSAGKLPSIFFVSDASQPFLGNRASFSVKLGICTPLSLLPFYIALWLSSYFSNIFLSRQNMLFFYSLLSLSLSITLSDAIFR